MTPVCSMCGKSVGRRPYIHVGRLFLGRDCARKIDAKPPRVVKRLEREANEARLEADFKARQLGLPL